MLHRSTKHHILCGAAPVAFSSNGANEKQEQEFPDKVGGEVLKAGVSSCRNLDYSSTGEPHHYGTFQNSHFRLSRLFQPCSVLYFYCLLLLSQCNQYAAFTDNVLMVSLKTSFKVISDPFLLTTLRVYVLDLRFQL